MHPPLPPKPKIEFHYCEMYEKATSVDGSVTYVKQNYQKVCLTKEDAKELAEYIAELERAAK